MRAKVLFSDGFFTSPYIDTTNKNLFQRIMIAANSGVTPGECATAFTIQSVESVGSATLYNTPEGRTFGGTLAILENPAFWPEMGKEAGVFLVRLDTREVHYWGGHGFEHSPEFTPTIAQVEKI